MKAKEKSAESIIRSAVRGQRKTIRIGMSSHTAGAGTGTPIVIRNGEFAPRLDGTPYLKTQFRGKGGFCKTLYTPSTLRIEVGARWILANIGIERAVGMFVANAENISFTINPKSES